MELCTLNEFLCFFPSRYKREFGFVIPSRNIMVDDIRVRGTAKACTHRPEVLPEATGEPKIEVVYARMLQYFILGKCGTSHYKKAL